MRLAHISFLLVVVFLSLNALGVSPSKDDEPVKVTLRLIARSVPVPYTSFGLIKDNYLAEIHDKNSPPQLAKVAYHFLVIEPELPKILSSGKTFTVRTRRDYSCDTTYGTFATLSIFDSGGNFLRTSTALLELTPSVRPEIAANTLLPCFWFTRSDLKHIVVSKSDPKN
jgi:hypothetical protein